MLSYQMFSYVTLDSVIKKKKIVNTIQSNLYYVGEGFDFSIYCLNYQSIKNLFYIACSSEYYFVMICYDTCEFKFFFKYIYDFLKTIFVTNDKTWTGSVR